MRCPFCKTTRDRVLDSRTSHGGGIVRRRRQCLNCRRRFTTYERVEMAPRMVLKSDSRHELFNREKILRGIVKACEKRNIPLDKIEETVARVESEIFGRYEHEVPSAVIGEVVTEALKNLDQVAFVRFASVYLRFKDISEFEQIIAHLAKKDAPHAKDK
ncbi:MAG TPA: transcriptional regulator NrdR [Planctomycetota bacterium]|jgi:transcriptional repressor NrdR|nr:transcriptional repressor NrdR [Planctomycetota bacterium]OQC19104.1 MAG: Transcriptional repressor NrdR [Planctomycetes bacterium ADurb.Bin069]NMD34318.1 transcriptional repressor NrdR [Planctomycetota bacterium]HNR98966.1 transcriptional regulator NrdR [Planctomycetota bacterium]HNU27114.1 transcriptional regulator NrdR [Planctomycetota bacterium]